MRVMGSGRAPILYPQLCESRLGPVRSMTPPAFRSVDVEDHRVIRMKVYG